MRRENKKISIWSERKCLCGGVRVNFGRLTNPYFLSITARVKQTRKDEAYLELKSPGKA